MKALKVIAIALVVYFGIVALFETLLGTFQPANEQTIVITTFDEEGSPQDRVVSLLESDGALYVAANHWPRAWYEQALARPEVEIAMAGERSKRLAVPVSGAEHDRVQDDNPTGLAFRLLTGFPPRYFVRLDPR